MPKALETTLPTWIETFQSRSRLDLLPQWERRTASGCWQNAAADPWGGLHRPDWQARGLLIWPRGGLSLRLRLQLHCPEAWRFHQACGARLALRWWAIEAQLRVDGLAVHRGDLYDSACRWLLPPRWWQGEPLELELELRSPLHDDGALILSRLELEPLQPADPEGLLLATGLELEQLRQAHRLGEPAGRLGGGATLGSRADAEALARSTTPSPGTVQVLGHAHLDLAWLWPVADTWQAAERTFRSALALMRRHPQLHFGHSTPALYAWLEQHRPTLFEEIRGAMRAGRWEPLNGPWVESDCVLISTASLLRQFQEGQAYSRRAFPEWTHELAWLPDSFGFAAGLPPVAAATGVRWFCTHKLAWNATNPFPHRLFRWRGRCGAELLTLVTAPIGSDGDPVAIERYRLEWQQATGCADALWLPGVGDHGGGPTAEMLEQLALWQNQPVAAVQRHGTVRAYLADLEQHREQLPVWRDELYLELHRGCATSRPDQKRHNRSLERLLREADLVGALLWAIPVATAGQPPESAPPAGTVDWRALLFQQFHDILPGTAIPDVFEQAEPQWHRARRQARCQRDQALLAWLSGAGPAAPAGPGQLWWLACLQALPAAFRTVRLPKGVWWQGDQRLPSQPTAAGGEWVQLASAGGVAALALRRLVSAGAMTEASAGGTALAMNGMDEMLPGAIEGPVTLQRADGSAGARWRLGNGLVRAELGPAGVEQLWGADALPQLASPLEWRRWRDRGEFWDAWDLAGDYRDHPLPLSWQGELQVAEQGPLCCRLVWRGQCGSSALRLDLQLLAGSPWLELTLRVDWRQRHELLRLELPLQQQALRWAADTSGGVLERPARVCTPREASRWEVPAISWVASQAADGGLAVLLDGPQGVSAGPQALGVSLLRSPSWPDPGADQGVQRLRLALCPCPGGWRQAAVPAAAVQFREPLWLRPAPPGMAAGPAGWRRILDLGSRALQLVALRPDPEQGVLQLTAQNLSPCRQTLALGGRWQLLGRLNAGQRSTAGRWASAGPERLGPWELVTWRIRAQSS